MSINRKLGKQNVVSPKLESHSGTERNDVLIYVSTWTSLENIMLSKKKLSHKKAHAMILFIFNVQNRQIHTEGRKTNSCQGLGREEDR